MSFDSVKMHTIIITNTKGEKPYLPLVKRRPFTAPKVEQATKTGTIQLTGPRYKFPTL